jgi:HlyD family secretion protein
LYLTAVVTRGDVVETVQTSGTVQPVVQVQVGSQVSGRVVRVLADFNARVRAGEVIAEVDPTSFQASVAQARASLLAAEAQLRRARVNERVTGEALTRAQALRAQGLNAQAEADTARGQRDLASAEVAVAGAEIARARASLQLALTNLANTRVRAPIDGVVIQRNIDEGQTVAASFQAPVLFVIANDLRRMRIVANVDEADIAKLREHMTARARVDAFPGEAFEGEVTELRYGAVTTAGVVTYPAVVTVANPELKLRPGMTATIEVTTNRHGGVFRVPNAALRFRPSSATGPAREPEGAHRGVLYVLRSGRPVRLEVQTGLADERQTEVSAEGLREGDAVVTDETDAAAQGRRGPGMPGAFNSSSGGGRGRPR